MSSQRFVSVSALQCEQKSDSFLSRRCNGGLVKADDLRSGNWFRCERCSSLYLVDESYVAWGPYRYPIDHQMADTRRRFGYRHPEDPSFLRNAGSLFYVILLAAIGVPMIAILAGQYVLGMITFPLLFTSYPLELLGISGFAEKIVATWVVILAAILLAYIVRRQSPSRSLRGSDASSD